ncbi:hypothetical protein [Halapricum salinum]|uniref:VanZ family protein n=1 Tax=Halapricum salinum TaxID=1457250 RepID=A0A4D6H9F5_9EURY|nr:hypothetical protein [Halapricum salinum]QCC50295.1 hypothetical protein DV733_03165 [Halapricum salinum]
MSSEEAYVPGVVRWFIVAIVLGLVLVAAFWRPESAVTRPGPLGLLDERTWVEGASYGVLTLTLLYAISPASSSGTISPLFVPIFVLSLACLLEAGQALTGVATFEAVDLVAAAACSIGVTLVWDAGRRAIRLPPA